MYGRQSVCQRQDSLLGCQDFADMIAADAQQGRLIFRDEEPFEELSPHYN
jgi:hypothetical protein